MDFLLALDWAKFEWAPLTFLTRKSVMKSKFHIQRKFKEWNNFVTGRYQAEAIKLKFTFYQLSLNDYC